MNQNTTDREILDKFQKSLADGAVPRARWLIRLTRANGTIEETIIPENIITSAGLNAIAAAAVGLATGANSAIAYLAIGTVTAQHSLGSVVTGFGEVSRKTASLKTTSKMTIIVAATWAGNADSLTGVAFGSAACVNHASSGLGTAFNLTNSLNATMQASDFLYAQCELQIGSHNL